MTNEFNHADMVTGRRDFLGNFDFLSKQGILGLVGAGVLEPFGVLDKNLVLNTLSRFLPWSYMVCRSRTIDVTALLRAVD
ncbi:MAG: hypothetical protein LBL95_06250, partial [Deltaproteobacteria bacterium]|nr:hypothetical protein [Deltaproteobacteria bacterium]